MTDPWIGAREIDERLGIMRQQWHDLLRLSAMHLEGPLFELSQQLQRQLQDQQRQMQRLQNQVEQLQLQVQQLQPAVEEPDSEPVHSDCLTWL